MSVPAPNWLKGLGARIFRLVLPHDGRDNSAYWRRRAGEAGSAAVLWQNPTYNRLVRAREYAQIAPYLADLPPDPHILDIGCGIGEVACWLLAQRDDIHVTGVDFAEMVARAARELPPSPRMEWVGASAADFVRPGAFDLVLSSGCYSAIRDKAKCRQAIEAGCQSVRPGGRLICIDPFHRHKYLARVRMGPDEVMAIVQASGLVHEHFGGILFWPMRELLANSRASDSTIERGFATGERWLQRWGERRWSDYKVLVFRRP